MSAYPNHPQTFNQAKIHRYFKRRNVSEKCEVPKDIMKIVRLFFESTGMNLIGGGGGGGGVHVVEGREHFLSGMDVAIWIHLTRLFLQIYGII